MRIEQCENGHFYDAQRFAVCPYCEGAYLFEGELPPELGLFRIDQMLGKGRTSKVFRIRPKSGYAVKAVEIPDQISEHMAENEYKIAGMLKGEKAFLEYYNMFKHGNRVYFVQPEVVNIERYIRQRNLHVLDVISLLEKSVEAVTLLNSKRILHLDIKPSNIFVDHMRNVKIGDFSVSCTFDDYKDNPSRRGTPKFYSPEVFHRTGFSGKEDMYSLGITIYYILSGGKYPYDFGDTETRSEESVYIENPDFLEEINQLVRKATAFDPDDRYENMEEMLDAFRRLNQKINKYAMRPFGGNLYQNDVDTYLPDLETELVTGVRPPIEGEPDTDVKTYMGMNINPDTGI